MDSHAKASGWPIHYYLSRYDANWKYWLFNISHSRQEQNLRRFFWWFIFSKIRFQWFTSKTCFLKAVHFSWGYRPLNSTRFISLTLFRIGWGSCKKAPIPVFPLEHLPTYELFPKTFWLLVFMLLLHCCEILRPYLVPVSNYWTWTTSTAQKIGFSSQIFMIIFLAEMLELLKIGHMTTSTK